MLKFRAGSDIIYSVYVFFEVIRKALADPSIFDESDVNNSSKRRGLGLIGDDGIYL